MFFAVILMAYLQKGQYFIPEPSSMNLLMLLSFRLLQLLVLTSWTLSNRKVSLLLATCNLENFKSSPARDDELSIHKDKELKWKDLLAEILRKKNPVSTLPFFYSSLSPPPFFFFSLFLFSSRLQCYTSALP